MAPKTKKQTQPVQEEEPAAKKAKAEEEPKAEEPKVEAEPKFEELDAPKDSRPACKELIRFETADTTLNVVPTLGGKMLTAVADGGMAYLVAGARANVAQKAGRYMFEIKIMQTGGDKANKPMVRIGFSTSEAGLVLGADASSVSFDSESMFISTKKKTQLKNARIAKGQVAAVVLNLDPKSPNFNTIALYRDGASVSDPMPLPEDLKGKALFPHVAYRNASVQVNFGPAALKELPFKCRLLQGAAASDVTVAASKEAKDGKYEVVMPVAFPDEGTFDWLDTFLEKNPQYVELSDRKIVDWARASGLHPKNSNQKASNDRPQCNFGVPALDDMSVRKVISAVAPVMPRNYLIMEVKSNLVAGERKELLKKFNYPCYKKIARVVMGEPTKDFKALVQNKLLKDKQAKSDFAFKAKKAEVLRKKAAEKKAQELAKQRKEAEKKRQAAIAEKKKKAEEEKKAKEGGDAKEEEKKDEPMEEEKVEEEKEEPAVEEEEETEPPVVELTEEEKKQFFMKGKAPDLTQQVMAIAFSKFTTPEEDEGFDDIQYEWQKGDKAKDYLQQWVLNKKLTTRVDDIKPGKVFREKVAEYQKLTKEWKEKLVAFKASPKKAKEAEDIDIFSVADVNDIGSNVPLFAHFTFEDWALMQLRFEYCLLVLSFKADTNDADRVGIPAEHLNFYFQKYYSKSINAKNYGMADSKEVLGLIKDTVVTKDSLLVSQLSDDLENLDIFLKLTEEGRRERQRRIDAGDETARLKFVAPVEPKPAAAKTEAKPAEPKDAAKTTAPAAAKPDAAKKGTKGWGKGGKGKW